MLRKIMAVLGIAMALALLGSLLTPAQAWQTDVNCNSHGRPLGQSDGNVCVEVQWHRQADGTGVIVDNVQLTATPDDAFEQDGVKVDGYGLVMYNALGDEIWSQAGSNCNIGQSGLHFYGMGADPFKVHRPGSVEYYYKARLNNGEDRTATIWVSFG
jgi:hypothetical protein